MKQLLVIIHAFRDLFVRWLPNTKKDLYAFAFLVHPRGVEDIYRKYPFFRFLPKKATVAFFKHFWPIVASKITGLQSTKNHREVVGYVLGITLTAKQMLENRALAQKKIVQAMRLAEKMGVKIVGLGALTSSVTRGGLDLIDKVNVNITTGHALTAHIVTSNLFMCSEIFGLRKENVIIAIVGATGSIGSTTAQILARAGYNNFILVDLERKGHLFKDLVADLVKLNRQAHITIEHQIPSVKAADFIITATNAPEAVVSASDVKSGCIIINDAQPSDVAEDVYERDDVIVLEGGLIHTPGVHNNFNFGLHHRQDNYSCLGEALVLASQEWSEHYVINRASLALIDEIAGYAKKLGFHLAEFQNNKEIISKEKLSNVGAIMKKNNVQA
jgi:predicted amino acid dehydrogenase